MLTLLGVLIGAFAALSGGLVLQARADKRRTFGAARLVASELRRNASEVERYFVKEQLERDGGTLVEWMESRVSVEAWKASASELMHLADPDLRDNLLGLYAYLDRFERAPSLQRPNIPDYMRAAAMELEERAIPTWWDRHVLRLMGGGGRSSKGKVLPTTPADDSVRA